MKRHETALKKYARLECPGLWQPGPDLPRREVIVSFRAASLILSDPGSGQALAHWSLPAVTRLNGRTRPALFSPDAAAEETLEVEDDYMIAALDTVRGALEAARPHPGRLRNWVLAGTFALVVAGALTLPGALVSHTLDVVPDATRVRLGEMALSEMVHLTGTPCATTLGTAATESLSTRIFNAASIRVLIVRDGLDHPVHLPNSQILIPARYVEDFDSPAPLAGAALVERLQAEAEDPLRPVLEHAGILATLRLLTTGDLPPRALDGYAEALAAEDPPSLPDGVLTAAFTAAELPLTPWARAAAPAHAEALIAADPWPEGPPRDILPDNEWISLSAICRG
ncbi:hypothetical protein [Falsirhodobacter algicola]|uniref:Uncharacterized protein n=1 Tax=Falsirhodobacter algicola TaxID=2692330 RepID=A0A8J8SKZ0_9RHOB|nr:hypothetical protein [Falsirhodobacter algicola]QUS35849.1 hypothetical protein GR316_05990 [Falsirhodobacter algicola]